MATAAPQIRKGRQKRRVLFRMLILAVCVVGASWIWTLLFPGPVARGYGAYRRGDWAEAARLAQERLQANRDDPQALALLARASVKLGRLADARGIYVRLEPRQLAVEDHYLMGMAMMGVGQVDVAQNAWRSALRADPNHAESLYQMAQVAFIKGQTVEGTQAALRLARQPGWESRGDLVLGKIRALYNDPAAAADALRRALDRDPAARVIPSQPHSAQKLLAHTLLQVSRSAEARDQLLSVLSAGPDKEASWLLSRAYLQDGAIDQATEALKHAGSYRQDFPIDPEPAPFVGETKCAECHRPIYDASKGSRHARTLLWGRQLGTLPLPDHPLPDPYDASVTHGFRRSGDQVQIETRAGSRVFRAVVEYALGATDRYAGLITRDDDGKERTFRLSYYHNAKEHGWELSKATPEHPARAKDFLGEPLGTAEGAGECLACHTTTARSVREQTGPESRDRGIGCDRRHGPGGLHLISVASRFSDAAIATATGTSAAGINRLCGTCHSQHFQAMPAAHTDPQWARFPGSSLPRSRCFTESGGALHCVTCHDPHRDADTSAALYEKRCLTCHATSQQDSRSPQAHQTESAFRSACPVSPTRNCLQCHMRKVPYPQLHSSFTDHYIRVPEKRNQPKN